MKVRKRYAVNPIVFCLLNNCVGQISSEITLKTKSCKKLNKNNTVKNSVVANIENVLINVFSEKLKKLKNVSVDFIKIHKN